MPSNTTLAALRAMCNVGGEFASAGAGNVSIVPLPRDKDTVQFVVAGAPVFSIDFGAVEGSLRWQGFNGSAVGMESRSAAVDALDFLFDALEVSASAELVRGELQVRGRAVCRGVIDHTFPLATLHQALEDSKPRQRMRQ